MSTSSSLIFAYQDIQVYKKACRIINSTGFVGTFRFQPENKGFAYLNLQILQGAILSGFTLCLFGITSVLQ